MRTKKIKDGFSNISIVTPFYNEGELLEIYFKAVLPILNSITQSWEIICIDDGSSDATKQRLAEYANFDKRIKVISFSRNFGKEAALTAGLNYAKGDAVIPLDADLQDPPSLIPQMVKKWQDGYDVVLAKRSRRDESICKRACAYFFHKIINILSNGNIPESIGDYRLIDKKVLNEVKKLKERTRYMKGVFSWVGFKSVVLEYERPARVKGEVKINFMKLLNLGLDGIISFSSKPLRVWLYLGLIISLVSFIYACHLILKTLIFGIDLPGYTSIMVAILFMGGIQLISLGVIGEYIARIFKEVKHRPIYIIDETYGIETKPQKALSKKARRER